MRNVCAAVLMGALVVSPTLVLADTGLAAGKPAGVKKAQVMDSPLFAIALLGAAGLAIGLAASSDDGVTPVVPPTSPPTST